MKKTVSLLMMSLLVMAAFLVGCAKEEGGALSGEATFIEMKDCKADNTCLNLYNACSKEKCFSISQRLSALTIKAKSKVISKNDWLILKDLRSKLVSCQDICYNQALKASLYQIEEGAVTLSCGTEVTESLVLANNIKVETPGACLTFKGQNIVFDCNGHTIEGVAGENNYLLNEYGATVKNCKLVNVGIVDTGAPSKYENNELTTLGFPYGAATTLLNNKICTGLGTIFCFEESNFLGSNNKIKKIDCSAPYNSDFKFDPCE